jgi:hypothetical protein
MIIAQHLAPPDAKTTMWSSRRQYGEPPPGIFCPACGRRIDYTTMNPRFKAPRSYFDLMRTYDGDYLVSPKLREYLEQTLPAGLTFLPIPSTRRFFALINANVVAMDPLPRLKKEQFCEVCREYRSVFSGFTFDNDHDLYLFGLKGIPTPVRRGLYVTDLRFGEDSRMWQPLVVGLDTWAELKAQGFKGIDGFPIDNRLNPPPRP